MMNRNLITKYSTSMKGCWKVKSIVMASILALTLTACAPMTAPGPPPITAAEIASADYGPPPPENYEELVKASIRTKLIDPTSPLFEMGSPSKGYTNQSYTYNTQEAFGWRVCGTVNSKNRYGGYTGRVPFFTLFQGDVVIKTIIGEATTNNYTRNYINMSIESSCYRRVD